MAEALRCDRCDTLFTALQLVAEEPCPLWACNGTLKVAGVTHIPESFPRDPDR
jgi:hypothetical protein